MNAPARPATRSGSVLVIIAGLSALLVSLALAFLVTTRTDVEEMNVLVSEAQARIMLTAACSYIQEASRLGLDPDTDASGGRPREHVEGHGWIDVRDGSLGPRVNTGALTVAMRNADRDHPIDVDSRAPVEFRVGHPVRFPMHALVRPPYAIKPSGTNPVLTTGSDAGRAFLRYPDPMPATDNGWVRDPANPAGTVSAAHFAEWERGDPTPRAESFARSWFRIVREAAGAVFTVTCGSGGTQGYRTWQEVVDDGTTALFSGGQGTWESMRDDEVRMWFRVEWSPAAASIDMNYLREGMEQTFALAGMNYSGGGLDHSGSAYSGQYLAPNMGGTIQWIQRLRDEPPIW